MTSNSTIQDTAFGLHRKEDFKTLQSLCDQFYGQTVTQDNWNKTIQEKAANYFSKLKITIPPQEMTEIFDQYHIIALRKLNQSDLLVFCGNKPLSCFGDEYSESSRKGHAHSKFDTVDYSILMNPTYVAQWPLNESAFPYFCNKNYKSINGESMSVLDFDNITKLKKGFKALQTLLESGGTSKCTYTYASNDPRLGYQYYMWGHQESLVSRIYKNCLSLNWYANGIKWLFTTGSEEEDLQIIKELANSNGLQVMIEGPKSREGVFCDTEWVQYKHPVRDYELTFTKV